MLKLNRGDQAKNCFMEALALDVKCYDAFEQLVSGEMMTPEEGLCILLYCLLIFHINFPQNGNLCKGLRMHRKHRRTPRSFNLYTQHDSVNTSTQKNMPSHGND